MRLIFQLFFEGLMTCQIAKELTVRHILTVIGKEKWDVTTTKGVLANEKYTGCARIQNLYAGLPHQESRQELWASAELLRRIEPSRSLLLTLPCSRWYRGRWSDAHGRAEDTAA